MISGGVVYSLPWQNGQKPPFFLCDEGEIKSVGLLPLSTEMITQRPVIGSLLSSDTIPPFDSNKPHPENVILALSRIFLRRRIPDKRE